jgi:hypothetical protein
MKKTIFFALFLPVVFTVYAQNIDKSSYAEITYDDFMVWNETGAGNGVPERFKMYLNYNGPFSPGYSFKDGDEDIILASEKKWDYAIGQKVVVYFTVTGPLVWDRSIDAIEVYEDFRRGRGPALVPDFKRPPASGSAQVLLPPEANRVIIEINREANGNLRLSIENPDAPLPSNAYPPNPSASSRLNASGTHRSVTRTPPTSEVKVIPRLPAQSDRSIYKIQAGAFVDKTRADELFAALQNAGFSPVHEKFGEWNRVIISGVSGSDVSVITRQLYSVGVKAVWLRK